MCSEHTALLDRAINSQLTGKLSGLEPEYSRGFAPAVPVLRQHMSLVLRAGLQVPDDILLAVDALRTLSIISVIGAIQRDHRLPPGGPPDSRRPACSRLPEQKHRL